MDLTATVRSCAIIHKKALRASASKCSNCVKTSSTFTGCPGITLPSGYSTVGPYSFRAVSFAASFEFMGWGPVADRSPEAALLQHLDPCVALKNSPVGLHFQRLVRAGPKRFDDFLGRSRPVIVEAAPGIRILFIKRIAMDSSQPRLCTAAALHISRAGARRRGGR